MNELAILAQRYTSHRERVIGQAVTDRKITASQVTQYRQWFDENPQAYEHLLTASPEQGGLMAGLVPEGTEPPGIGLAPAGDDDYPRGWFFASTGDGGSGGRVHHEEEGFTLPVGAPTEAPLAPGAATGVPTGASVQSARVDAAYPREWFADEAPGAGLPTPGLASLVTIEP